MKRSHTFALIALPAIVGLMWIGRPSTAPFEKTFEQPVVIVTNDALKKLENGSTKNAIAPRPSQTFNLQPEQAAQTTDAEQDRIVATLFGSKELANNANVKCSGRICYVALDPPTDQASMRNAAILIQVSAGLKDAELASIGFKALKTPVSIVPQNGESAITLLKM